MTFTWNKTAANTFYWFPLFLTLTVSGLWKQRWAGKSFQQLALIRQGNAFWSAVWMCHTCYRGGQHLSFGFILAASGEWHSHMTVGPRAQICCYVFTWDPAAERRASRQTVRLYFWGYFFSFFFSECSLSFAPSRWLFTAGEDGTRERMIPRSCWWRICDHTHCMHVWID